jgi:hypothetical protein
MTAINASYVFANITTLRHKVIVLNIRRFNLRTAFFQKKLIYPCETPRLS